MPELTSEAWAQIRYAYEHTSQPIEEICAAHRISSGTLRDRMRRWGWTRRRPPIPREGPPAVAMRESETEAALLSCVTSPHSPPKTGVNALVAGEAGEPQHREPGEGQQAAENPEPPHPNFLPGPDSDPASIGPRLQGAVARVLPAIEATLSKLAFAPGRPRDMEQMARALGSLTRTLRELNGLLAQHDTQAEEPLDIDDMRRELARRVEGLVARQNAEMPRRYEAAWHEFAAEMEGAASATDDCRTAPADP